MTGFSNATIQQVVKHKPHICIREGWWRVCPLPKNEWPFPTSARWRKAHDVVWKLNQKLKQQRGIK